MGVCGDICGDNRFEIIAKAKKNLLESTNIHTSEDEMKVLDSFLFRCWQMGWLNLYDDDVKVVHRCTIETYLNGLREFKVFLGMVTEMREAQRVYSDTFPTGYGCYAPIDLEKEVDEYLKTMEE